MAFIRKYNEQVVLVILNLSNHDRVFVNLNHPSLQGNLKSLFSGLDFYFNKENKVELMAGEYLVYTNFVF